MCKYSSYYLAAVRVCRLYQIVVVHCCNIFFYISFKNLQYSILIFFFSVHQSPNCGPSRRYLFRMMSGRSFRFRVKAGHDANLCLSGAAAEVPHHMYEIFLGGWNGAESAIRRNKRDDVCKVKTPNILSQHEFRGFWVVVTKNAIKVSFKNYSGLCNVF